MALPPPPASAGGASGLYSYSTNTSTSTVSQAPRPVSARDSRYSGVGLGGVQPVAHGAHGQGHAGGERNILDRSLNRSKGVEVGLAAWAFLFSEIVAYSQSRVDSVADLEKRWVGGRERSWGGIPPAAVLHLRWPQMDADIAG